LTFRLFNDNEEFLSFTGKILEKANEIKENAKILKRALQSKAYRQPSSKAIQQARDLTESIIACIYIH